VKPVFVYGTLRRGCGNDRIWQGKGVSRFDGDCFVAGFRLVTNGAFPYALPAEEQTAVGALVYPNDAAEMEVLSRLDALEGVPYHYERHTVDVETPEGVVVAWMYVPTQPEDYEDYETVPANDWNFYRQERRGSNSRWKQYL